MARERGLASEAAALRAAQTAAERIPWVRSARAATPDEDRQKIDIVVGTFLGAMHLQVKSSQGAARAWAQANGHRMIEVVVASHVPSEMEARVDGALWRLRRRVEERRAGIRRR